jgi:hypothetical protein
VPVVFLITIVAVLVGIFFAATGRGGEMAYERADYAPLDLGPVSAADVALLRPPTAMWGYNMQVTDEALDRIARAMRGRDVMIAYLQEQLASLDPSGSYAESRGAHAHQPADSPLAPEFPSFPGNSEISEAAGLQEAPEAPQAPEALETLEPSQPVEAAESAETVQAPMPLQTPLILKASPAKVPPAPEPHEATQPSETLRDPEAHDATQPSEAQDATQPSEAQDATQPLETQAPHEALGPQGSFNTHDWWAEQQAAAREEEVRRPAAGLAQIGLAPEEPAQQDLAQEDLAQEERAGRARPAAGPFGAAGDDSLAAAEEPG